MDYNYKQVNNQEEEAKVDLNCSSLVEDHEKPREPWRNLIGFFLIGLMNNFSYVVMLSAAKDIIHESDSGVSVGVILLADTIPNLIVKLVAPILFMEKIPYWMRVITITASATGSFQMVAWINNLGGKLAGVGLASFGTGLGEITFLARTSYYHKNTISAWGSGTGGAGGYLLVQH